MALLLQWVVYTLGTELLSTTSLLQMKRKRFLYQNDTRPDREAVFCCFALSSLSGLSASSFLNLLTCLFLLLPSFSILFSYMSFLLTFLPLSSLLSNALLSFRIQFLCTTVACSIISFICLHTINVSHLITVAEHVP